jgi:hypothetical protein
MPVIPYQNRKEPNTMNQKEKMYERIKKHGENLNAIFHTGTDLTDNDKNPVLRRALRAAILSAGAWSERFQGGAGITFYPPYVPAGIRALVRAGRRDLIPALRRRIDSGRYDITSLRAARSLVD